MAYVLLLIILIAAVIGVRTLRTLVRLVVATSIVRARILAARTRRITPLLIRWAW